MWRPRPGQTEDDLRREEEDLIARGNFIPSAKVVSKRKTEEPAPPTAAGDGPKPKSKFAQERAAKKKKEGIVDNTVLMEASSQERKAFVIGRIVEREVSPDQSLREWHPTPSPQGFPRVPKLGNLGDANKSTPETGNKSLYMQHLEKQGLVKSSAASAEDGSTSTARPDHDHRVAALGTHSYIIEGHEGPGGRSEAEEIHEENIGRLASMSHAERMREREELLASLTGEQVDFLQSLRKKRGNVAKESRAGSDPTMESEGAESTAVEDSTMDTSQPSEPQSEDRTAEGKTSRVRFSADVEMREEDDGVAESELPIPPSEARRWIHMDKVEMEKLRWFAPLPEPKPLGKDEDFHARFDFEGSILPYDSDVSYREALHHHEDEPGRAGYTLSELFVFIRSKVPQQRLLGLRVLANILRNAKEGLYDLCINPPILHLIIESGAVFLLRFAVDDKSHLIYSEAVRGLYYLVASEPDEMCLSMAQPWVPSGIEPGISSDIHACEKTRQELDQDEKELKDFEVVKLDVIRALVRMDTHLRLRYLLETLKPRPETVIYVLGILRRMVRHSLTAAWTVARTPRLISTIVENFLPHNLAPLLTGESATSVTSVYGVPLRHALHLLRVLAARGRQLAAILVNSHRLMSRILAYVSLDPSEASVPQREVLALSQEAYATWSVLLAYGLTKPQEAVSSFYPMFAKQLMVYRDKVPVGEESDGNRLNHDVGAHMINALTRAVNVAATRSLLVHRMRLNQGTLVGANDKAEVLPPPQLAWDDLSHLRHLVEACLAKWLAELARSGKAPFSALRLVGSCCAFLDSYYVKWKDQTSYGSEALKAARNLYDEVLSPALRSSALKALVGALPSHSSLACDLVSGTGRDPSNLGSLGCVTLGGEVVPLLRSSTPHPLLLPLSGLLASLHALHPSLDGGPTRECVDSEGMTAYLERTCRSRQGLASQWLTRIETHLVGNVLRLSSLKGCERRRLHHETALRAMTHVHRGDEHLIKVLLSVICAPEFTSDLTEASVGDLSLQDRTPLHSPATVQPVASPTRLTQDVVRSLKSMEGELVGSLASKREYSASAVLKCGVPFSTNGLTINRTKFPLILDEYWPLEPIRRVYKTSRQGAECSRERSSPEDLLAVTRCLQTAYLVLKHRRSLTLDATSATAWMQHLSLVFLVADDVFLDAGVASYLQGCIAELLRDGGHSDRDFHSSPEGFGSPADWYGRLLDQFEGVSYGDSTFALYLLVPLQRHWPLECRKKLWADAPQALRFFRLTSEQVEAFIPVEQFLKPDEEDEGMITKYRSGIGSGLVTASRNPFLHRVALHHVRRHLQREGQKQTTSS